VHAQPARPQAARHLIATLTSHGLAPAFAESVVDDALQHRLPFAPAAGPADVVATELAHRIPVAPIGAPAGRTLVFAGARGAGTSRLVAGIAAAYASRTTIDVACIALTTPDGGRALAGALAPFGVPVHAAPDGAHAVAQIAALGPDVLVLVDTPPLATGDADHLAAAATAATDPTRLAADLATLGAHELHLTLGPGGGAAHAAALLGALRPARLALGDPSAPEHLGAALQVVVDRSLPLSFAASTAAAARPDLAVRPADPAALARALTT
jgi:hypothetical protein